MNKKILAIIAGIIIGIILMIVVDNYTISESEKLSYEFGYNNGVVAVSQDVMYKGILPVFNVTENNTEYLGELNLTTGVIR